MLVYVIESIDLVSGFVDGTAELEVFEKSFKSLCSLERPWTNDGFLDWFRIVENGKFSKWADCCDKCSFVLTRFTNLQNLILNFFFAHLAKIWQNYLILKKRLI